MKNLHGEQSTMLLNTSKDDIMAGWEETTRIALLVWSQQPQLGFPLLLLTVSSNFVLRNFINSKLQTGPARREKAKLQQCGPRRSPIAKMTLKFRWSRSNFAIVALNKRNQQMLAGLQSLATTGSPQCLSGMNKVKSYLPTFSLLLKILSCKFPLLFSVNLLLCWRVGCQITN